MMLRVLLGLAIALLLAVPCVGQESTPASPAGQQPGQSGNGPGSGQRPGGGGFGGGMMERGNAVSGTVTEAAADHYTIKTESGDSYTVRLSENTRIIKQTTGMRGPGEGQGGRQREGQPQGQGPGQNQGPGAGQGPEQAPAQGPGQGSAQGRQGQERGGFGQPLKASDIKVGDSLSVRGDVDDKTKTIGAQFVLQLDPQRAAEQRQQQADFGKTWLAGKVTAIDGVKVTLTGSADNAPHTFVADENTTFRRRREPVTMADIQSGDMVRVEGALKDGVFTATTVTLMAMPQTTPTLPSGAGPQSGPGQPGGTGP